MIQLSISFGLTLGLSHPCRVCSQVDLSSRLSSKAFSSVGGSGKRKCAKIIRTMYRVTYRAALQIQKRIKELWFSLGGGEVSSRKGFPLQQQPGHAGCLLSTLGILKLTQTLGGIIKTCGGPLPETSSAKFDWRSRMLAA